MTGRKNQHLQTISCTCLSTLCWSMGGQPAGSQSSQLEQWAESLRLLSAGPPASLLLGRGREGQASATHHIPRTPVAGSQSRLSSSGRKPSHKTQGDRAAAKRLPAPCLHSHPAPPPTWLARSPQFRGLTLKAYFDSGYMAKLPKRRRKRLPPCWLENNFQSSSCMALSRMLLWCLTALWCRGSRGCGNCLSLLCRDAIKRSVTNPTFWFWFSYISLIPQKNKTGSLE